MFEFGNKKKPTAADNGKQFMTQVKDDHAALFQSFIDARDEYDDIEEFIAALASQSWELLEATCKTSYRNGINRGQRRHQSDR